MNDAHERPVRLLRKNPPLPRRAPKPTRPAILTTYKPQTVVRHLRHETLPRLDQEDRSPRPLVQLLLVFAGAIGATLLGYKILLEVESVVEQVVNALQ